MKKIIALLLVFLLCFSGCGTPSNNLVDNPSSLEATNGSSTGSTTTENGEIDRFETDQFGAYDDETNDQYGNSIYDDTSSLGSPVKPVVPVLPNSS